MWHRRDDSQIALMHAYFGAERQARRADTSFTHSTHLVGIHRCVSMGALGASSQAKNTQLLPCFRSYSRHTFDANKLL